MKLSLLVVLQEVKTVGLPMEIFKVQQFEIYYARTIMFIILRYMHANQFMHKATFWPIRLWFKKVLS